MALKALIVDDMATYRSIIARCLDQIEGVEVIGKVSNGKRALDFLEKNPEVDFITLDVEMPIMDGLATLRELRGRQYKTDVVMLSGLSDQAAQLTIQCLELGAIDFVLKPQGESFVENQIQLVESLREIVKSLGRRSSVLRRQRKKIAPAPKPAPRPVVTLPKKRFTGKPKIVLIGISTGGPKALSEVFDNLKGPLPFPVTIVQHMPPKFTCSLAASLDRKTDIKIVEASDGEVIQKNTVYIAPGGFHMFLLAEEDFGLVVGTNQEKPVNSCRPSVDVLFKSAINFFKPGEVVSIIMTGMGRDGADGASELSKAGAHVTIQSEETCTIYGMPKSVEDLGVHDQVLHLQDIAPFIKKLAGNGAGLRFSN